MGGGGGDPSAQARRDEQARQARIDTTITGVNQLYDAPERQAQITNYGNDLLSYFTRDLDKQKTVADRDLKFANARSGTIGGSLQVDQNRQLGTDYQEGVLNVGRKAQAGMADLRAADEQSRLNLTSLAQNGLSTTNAATQAAAAMRSALETSSAANKAQGIGDIFGSVLTAKNKSEESAAKRKADKIYAQPYTPFYGVGD
jgi:hypothetical protein